LNIKPTWTLRDWIRSIPSAHRFSPFIFLLVAALAIMTIWWKAVFVVEFAHYHFDAVESKPHLLFTETYTALSALFAGLAFAAVAWNLIIQQRQITYGRVKEQFFQLLHTWKAETRDILYKDDQGNEKRGNDALLRAENDLLGEYNGDRRRFSNPGKFFGKMHDEGAGATKRLDVKRTYRSFYEEKLGAIAYLFRLQYQILKTIDASPLSRSKRIELADVYRSMLSDPELHLLVYFALSSYAPKDYCNLICEYRLLDNLLYKEVQFIADRIPEIELFPAYRNWQNLQIDLIRGRSPL